MSRNLTPGLILIAIGIIFLLSNFNIIGSWSEWWPLILVAVGIGMLFQRKNN